MATPSPFSSNASFLHISPLLSSPSIVTTPLSRLSNGSRASQRSATSRFRQQQRKEAKALDDTGTLPAYHGAVDDPVSVLLQVATSGSMTAPPPMTQRPVPSITRDDSGQQREVDTTAFINSLFAAPTPISTHAHSSNVDDGDSEPSPKRRRVTRSRSNGGLLQSPPPITAIITTTASNIQSQSGFGDLNQLFELGAGIEDDDNNDPEYVPDADEFPSQTGADTSVSDAIAHRTRRKDPMIHLNIDELDQRTISMLDQYDQLIDQTEAHHQPVVRSSSRLAYTHQHGNNDNEMDFDFPLDDSFTFTDSLFLRTSDLWNEADLDNDDEWQEPVHNDDNDDEEYRNDRTTRISKRELDALRQEADELLLSPDLLTGKTRTRRKWNDNGASPLATTENVTITSQLASSAAPSAALLSLPRYLDADGQLLPSPPAYLTIQTVKTPTPLQSMDSPFLLSPLPIHPAASANLFGAPPAAPVPALQPQHPPQQLPSVASAAAMTATAPEHLLSAVDVLTDPQRAPATSGQPPPNWSQFQYDQLRYQINDHIQLLIHQCLITQWWPDHNRTVDEIHQRSKELMDDIQSRVDSAVARSKHTILRVPMLMFASEIEQSNTASESLIKRSTASLDTKLQFEHPLLREWRELVRERHPKSPKKIPIQYSSPSLIAALKASQWNPALHCNFYLYKPPVFTPGEDALMVFGFDAFYPGWRKGAAIRLDWVNFQKRFLPAKGVDEIKRKFSNIRMHPERPHPLLLARVLIGREKQAAEPTPPRKPVGGVLTLTAEQLSLVTIALRTNPNPWASLARLPQFTAQQMKKFTIRRLYEAHVGSIAIGPLSSAPVQPAIENRQPEPVPSPLPLPLQLSQPLATLGSRALMEAPVPPTATFPASPVVAATQPTAAAGTAGPAILIPVLPSIAMSSAVPNLSAVNFPPNAACTEATLAVKATTMVVAACASPTTAAAAESSAASTIPDAADTSTTPVAWTAVFDRWLLQQARAHGRALPSWPYASVLEAKQRAAADLALEHFIEQAQQRLGFLLEQLQQRVQQHQQQHQQAKQAV